MARRVTIRLLQGALTVLLITAAAFLMEFIVPGDPARAIAPRATPQTLQSIHDQLHLNQSLVAQFGYYFRNLLEGNLGQSYAQREPVSTLIAQRLPATILLAVSAVVVEVVIGGTLGVLAALHRRAGPVTSVISLVLLCIPTFVLGLLLLLVFGFTLSLAPVTGGEGPAQLVLPALVLGLAGVPWYAQIVRDQMADSLSSSYVRTAIAKGLPNRWILRRHVLRNVVSPALTMVGMDLGIFISGVVVVETVFGWPGLGELAVQSLDNLDRPVILGIAIVSAVAVVVLNIAVDVIRWYVDPRTIDLED